MSTILDVAEKAKVSIATVSRALNNQPGCSEETRKKVMRIAQELGYEPNEVARSLINKKTNTIGVIIPEISSLLSSEFINGIDAIAKQESSNLIVTYTKSNIVSTEENLKMLHEKRVDGIIFVSEILRKEYYDYIKRNNIPCVLLSTKSAEYASVPYVKVDDYDASYAATNYLIKMGHKKIGLISGSSADPIAGNPRIDGYKKAISDNLNKVVEERQIVSGNGFGFDDGRDNFIQLMKQFPELTAIFCVSDEMAIGAISAAYRLGIKIPEDVSIMGYDNLKISEMSVPPLTTTAQPLVKMAEKATEILFKIINKKADDVHSIIMPYQIIERDSVKKIK